MVAWREICEPEAPRPAARTGAHGTDRWDRRLVEVFVDGARVAEVMIEAGHARAYDGGARGDWCA